MTFQTRERSEAIYAVIPTREQSPVMSFRRASLGERGGTCCSHHLDVNAGPFGCHSEYAQRARVRACPEHPSVARSRMGTCCSTPFAKINSPIPGPHPHTAQHFCELLTIPSIHLISHAESFARADPNQRASLSSQNNLILSSARKHKSAKNASGSLPTNSDARVLPRLIAAKANAN
jgi:hypothetical protein